ncbi:MAG TPA: HupE/UreJ family protein, partial [Pirellulaceae bacterium]|nr:HupE/UreJ family protein [Pirellulaceae bacterium]
MSAAWFSCAILLLAHNPDTSYARIKISADKVETRLTYDVFTLLKIVPLDDNADGQLQRSELAGHAPEIADFLRGKIGLAVSDDDETADLGQFTGFVWPPDVGEAIAGVDFHSANGLNHFDFLRNLEQPPELVAIAFGFFKEFSDRHSILGVFECQGDKYETSFTNYEDYFEYATGFAPETPQTQHTLGERLWRFFKMGVEHIFLGYDHICFLVALIVVSRFREIVKIVT